MVLGTKGAAVAVSVLVSPGWAAAAAGPDPADTGGIGGAAGAALPSRATCSTGSCLKATMHTL